MYEIYQKLLDEKGVKNSDVSRATGISNMTLSDWKHGKSTPKQDKMRKIADYFNVPIEYLIYGDEHIFSEYSADIDVNLSNMEKRIKEYALKLSELPKEKQEQIMSLIDMLGENK